MSRILITGASSGIGEALTRSYQARGEQVIACGRSQAKLEQLTHLNGVSSLQFDITDREQVMATASQVGQLDTIILNAGDCEYIDDAINFDSQLFERVINVNLVSVAYCLEAWLPHLAPHGRLVFVSSSAQLLPFPRAQAYGASKAGLTYLANVMQIELARHDIAVSVVHPGFVATPLTDKNTFDMPFKITAEQAANYIIAGVDKGKSDINFPGLFIFILKFLRALPSACWRAIALRMQS
ncbi:SDR family NAD(P)-dependent oxidoreductase [Shewanella waksmanii]|uniref:SDR family NAD(P)-dependent oxidoreductase n=1 Tax=Shewanella waksmanii TaxID=213783 RepID=UPI003734F0BA